MRKEVIKYTKEQIINSKKLDLNKDVIQILLDESQEYSIDEVKKLVKDFEMKEVK